MGPKEVLLIIPAYNEEKNIGKVMDQLAQPEIANIVDVLVMNDASSDNTNWMAKQRGYAVVTHVFNLGYGSGLQLGYKYAIRRGYQYVIQMDADGQHDVCNIPKIYEKLKEKDTDGRTPDIVLGSRFMDGSAEFHVGFAKKLAFRLFRRMLHIATGRWIADPTTGLQGLSRKAVLYYSKYNHFDDKYHDHADDAAGLQGSRNSGGHAYADVGKEHAFRTETRLVYDADVLQRTGCDFPMQSFENGCGSRTKRCGKKNRKDF